jgi:hypothetical protein
MRKRNIILICLGIFSVWLVITCLLAGTTPFSTFKCDVYGSMERSRRRFEQIEHEAKMREIREALDRERAIPVFIVDR